jgi:hypothetical protein
MRPHFARDADVETEAEVVRAMARDLYRRAYWLTVTAVLGLGGVFGVMFYLWRDWKLGYNVNPAWFEGPAAGLVGALIGLGLSLPFAHWLRIQAGLVNVQLRMEESMRRTGQHAAETARTMREFADTGLSGEWRARDLGTDTTRRIRPPDDE